MVVSIIQFGAMLTMELNEKLVPLWSNALNMNGKSIQMLCYIIHGFKTISLPCVESNMMHMYMNDSSIVVWHTPMNRNEPYAT